MRQLSDCNMSLSGYVLGRTYTAPFANLGCSQNRFRSPSPFWTTEIFVIFGAAHDFASSGKGIASALNADGFSAIAFRCNFNRKAPRLPSRPSNFARPGLHTSQRNSVSGFDFPTRMDFAAAMKILRNPDSPGGTASGKSRLIRR